MDSNVRPETMERITTPELAEKFIAEQVEAVRAQVGDKKVLLALSGGVDSSVVAALLIKAIGKQLVCVHVNHGLMRKGESEQVVEVFGAQLDANLIYIDATDRFLDKLVDVSDPETKRKIIGGEFIKVFDEEAAKLAYNKAKECYKDQDPFLSIIVPCYNAETTLTETIESLKKQTYANFEVILVDDNSTDNTVKVIKELIKTELNINQVKSVIFWSFKAINSRYLEIFLFPERF